jgi:hypothetical protein
MSQECLLFLEAAVLEYPMRYKGRGETNATSDR